MFANNAFEKRLVLFVNEKVQLVASVLRIQLFLLVERFLIPLQHESKLAKLAPVRPEALIQPVNIRQFVVLLKLSRQDVFDQQRVAFPKDFDLTRLLKMLARVERIG